MYTANRKVYIQRNRYSLQKPPAVAIVCYCLGTSSTFQYTLYPYSLCISQKLHWQKMPYGALWHITTNALPIAPLQDMMQYGPIW